MVCMNVENYVHDLSDIMKLSKLFGIPTGTSAELIKRIKNVVS